MEQKNNDQSARQTKGKIILNFYLNFSIKKASMFSSCAITKNKHFRML